MTFSSCSALGSFDILISSMVGGFVCVLVGGGCALNRVDLSCSVEEGADQFLVMEYASGGDLYDWLERGTVTNVFPESTILWC
jgi:serine/threonine protein kinase